MASSQQMADEISTLVPPQPKFVLESGYESSEAHQRQASSSHSRDVSAAPSFSPFDSPPLTPTFTHTFAQAHHGDSPSLSSNPFSPPASVINFSMPERPPMNDGQRSGFNSRTASMTDIPRGHFGPGSSSNSRPGTPGYRESVNGSLRPGSARIREAFRSPAHRPLTMVSSANLSSKVVKERQKSTMLRPTDEIQKPWLETRDSTARVAYWLTYACIFLGVALGAVRCYTGYSDLDMMQGNMCPVIDEDFSGGEEAIFGDNGLFMREVDMSGFGNGEFQMTTDSSNNSFVKDGKLYIVPTLTIDQLGEEALLDNFVYNITGCTYNITRGFSYTSEQMNVPLNVSGIGSDENFDVAAYTRACSAVSNHTLAKIINPVQSARLNTRRTASLRFGRVDVRAKLPTGDWLWPAIWMMPVNNEYGPWPMSGEIDIMEARGNGPLYPFQGVNYVRGSLNWGPISWLNQVGRTFGFRNERHRRFDREYHTYTLEWDEKFIRSFVDNRLHFTLEHSIKKSFWDLGEFPSVIQNGSEAMILNNPWANGTAAAPFDRDFFLILSLGVGGTNGWFPDHSEKPWLNHAETAMAEFWRRREEWLPSWGKTTEELAFVIDSVKMYQKC